MANLTRLARHAGLLVSGLLGFGMRSGRWWIVACVFGVLVASVAAATTKSVPVVVYTLF